MMTKEELLDRLREEIESPFLDIPVEDKLFTEEEFQKLKSDLIKYFDDYVRNVEN